MFLKTFSADDIIGHACAVLDDFFQIFSLFKKICLPWFYGT